MDSDYVKVLDNFFTDILALKFEDQKTIFTDKHIDVAMEVFNIVFKDINQISTNHFITTLFGYPIEEKVSYIKPVKITSYKHNIVGGKKQVLLVGLVSELIDNLVNFIFNIFDEEGNLLVNIYKGVTEALIELLNSLIRFIETCSDLDKVVWDQKLFLF